jgi:predicted amidohydrolase YtcJ
MRVGMASLLSGSTSGHAAAGPVDRVQGIAAHTAGTTPAADAGVAATMAGGEGSTEARRRAGPAPHESEGHMTATADPGSQADLIIRGGPVCTVDPWRPRAEAVAVRGGVIVAVGTEEEVRALDGPGTELIDLDGRLLLPGFQDAHVHASGGGLERRHCDLTAVHGREEYLAVVSRYAADHPDVEWVTGGGWALDAFPSGIPAKEDLDRIVPDRPVFLSNRDHHGAWANSLAMERAGIDARSADPPDGRIERDRRGEPVGMLQEGAMELVRRVVPPPTVREIADGILEGQRYLHSVGITAWQEAIVGDYPVVPDCFDAYLALDQTGALTGRVVGAQWWSREGGEGQMDRLLTRREQTASGRRFTTGTVKFMQDGVCENFTAAMLEPYLDVHGGQTHNHGISFFQAEELMRYVTLVDAAGFQAHFHAIGDRAVREVLDAVAAARRANGPNDNRHCAAHIQVVHPEDLPRFAALGLVANGQPLWAHNDAQMTELTLPFVGPERSGRQYQFGSLARSGARLCFGSDWPVSTANVMEEIHVAVNRTAPRAAGQAAEADEPPLLPDERVSLEEAVAAFTMGSAYCNHLDGSTGSVAVGKCADLVILDRDVFGAGASEISLAAVDVTLVDGTVVYERSGS